MENPENMIEVRGLRFAYGRRTILKGIDLDIPRGKVVAILGASGSGKTTLLQIIGGLLRPAAGAVTRFGPNGPAPCGPALPGLRRALGGIFPKGRVFSSPSGFWDVVLSLPEHPALAEA